MMRPTRLRAALVAALLTVSCATRAIHPPSGAASALSPAHRPGVTQSVTRAIDEDPPLPGDPQGEWVGLSPDAPRAATADPHAHHHGAADAGAADAGAPEQGHGGHHAH